MNLPHGRPAVMGVLNVTPDSFSDGGAYETELAALEAGIRMVENGADLVDVGGESTRPFAEPIDEAEERRRVLPVVRLLVERGVSVSIDTMKAAIARDALAAGATVVNDVSALADPAMAEAVAGAGATVCLMHMQGVPKTMQVEPSYGDVVAEVVALLAERAATAQTAGIARERIWLDPGIGFGKTDEHNLALLRNLHQVVALGYPVMIGVSRKGFLGRLLGGAAPAPVLERLPGALAVQTLVQAAGVRIIRTHDVLGSRQAITVAAAILGS